MPFAKEIYQQHRLVLVRFERAGFGPPDERIPDPDNRGYTGSDHGPIVGMIRRRNARDDSNNIVVHLVRQNIDDEAPLFITSSDTSVVEVVDPAPHTSLPNMRVCRIQLQGIAGGHPRTAKVEVRFGTSHGPIIHELTVWVFEPLRVNLTPHFMEIVDFSGPNGAMHGIRPQMTEARLSEIMEGVHAIWKPCGVTFSMQPVREERVALARAGFLGDDPFPGEINTMLYHFWVPDTINLYFVHRIGTGYTLGYGYGRATYARHNIMHPCIINADTNASGAHQDLYTWTNGMAHEIGHFLGLPHPESQQTPNEREDTWSRRMLMHNFDDLRGPHPWPDTDSESGDPYGYRPRFNNVGYGRRRRGCLITMKNLSQLNHDGECSTARSTIRSAQGPY